MIPRVKISKIMDGWTEHNIRHDNEDLVQEQYAEIRPVNLDNAPNPIQVQQTVATTPSTSVRIQLHYSGLHEVFFVAAA